MKNNRHERRKNACLYRRHQKQKDKEVKLEWDVLDYNMKYIKSITNEECHELYFPFNIDKAQHEEKT